jgi:hypothetical protein
VGIVRWATTSRTVETRVVGFPAAFAAGPARIGFQCSLERFAEYLILVYRTPDIDPDRD